MTAISTAIPVNKARRINSAVAIAIVFVVHAALTTGWVPRIPVVQQHLRLDDTRLGLALVGAPLSEVVTVLFAGRLIRRVGSRRALLWLLPGFCLTAPLPGVANSGLTLFVSLVIWGGLGGSVGVAMNAKAVEVEAQSGRPILSRLHGLWSLGAFLGAGLGTAAGAAGMAVWMQLAAMGVLGGASSHLPMRGLPMRGLPASVAESTRSKGFARPRLLLAALALVAFCSLFDEGSAETWSAPFVAESARVRIGVAGIGYVAYALSMCSGRLAGDRIVRRFGPVVTIRSLVSLAALGFGTALLLPGLISDLLGFALLGFGFSAVIPLVFRASSRVPGTLPGSALAAVSSAGSLGLVAGPPVIGALATMSALRSALGLIVVNALVIVAAAGVTRLGGSADLGPTAD